jgi:hypothetical protein
MQDNEWARLYERLVKTRCPYDERTQSRVGKIHVIGRVAGQMTEAIYALLKRDAELLAKVLPGQEPPPPLLYDPEAHQRHHQGYYRLLKSTPLPIHDYRASSFILRMISYVWGSLFCPSLCASLTYQKSRPRTPPEQ